MGVFVSYGGFYILGMSSCKCSVKAAQCGSANRCHWSVARFFSFHSGGGEDARGGYGGFFGWSAALAVLEANLVVNLCKSRVRALSRGPAVAGHEVAS